MRHGSRAHHRKIPASLDGAGRGKRFVILASQFYPFLSRALIRGATRVLREAGVSSSDIRLLDVPGAFELPVVASRVIRSRRTRPDAVIALGALIRGDTPQYEVLAHAVAQGLSRAAVESGVPVTFGLIVAKTLVQAKARAGGVMGNRGEEAALAALSTLQLLKTL
jgi:6,7-dimethyl-8-ribityllumazine synthase